MEFECQSKEPNKIATHLFMCNTISNWACDAQLFFYPNKTRELLKIFLNLVEINSFNFELLTALKMCIYLTN